MDGNNKDQIINILESIIENIKKENVKVVSFDGFISNDSVDGVRGDMRIEHKRTGKTDYNISLTLYDDEFNDEKSLK